MIRTYARIASVVLLAVAIAGLVVLGWGTGEVFYHLVLVLLYAYAGFWQQDATTVRRVVGGLGALVLGVKGVQMLAAWVFPAVHLHRGPVQVSCLVVGITSVLAARYLPGGRATRGRVFGRD